MSKIDKINKSWIGKRSREFESEEFGNSKVSKKKCNSEEDKKRNIIINFVAKIDEKYKDVEFKIEERLTGDNLNFSFRRKMANKIMNSIKEGDDELKCIEEALTYDNTNKYIIYRLLKYYYKHKNEDEFDKVIKKYKYCLTKRFTIIECDKEIEINLNDFFKVKECIEELEEMPNHKVVEKDSIDLRNILVEVFSFYYHIANYIKESNLEKLLSKKEFKDILTYKYRKDNKNNSVLIDFDRDKKIEILKRKIEKVDMDALINNMEGFLFKYIYIKEFEFFQMNQPVSYKNNLTLYFNYIIYLLYETAIQVNETENTITFRKIKLSTYFSLLDFHDLLFDDLIDKGIPIDDTIDKLLQFLLFSLSSNNTDLFIDDTYIHLNNRDKFLDQISANKFVEKLNKKFKGLNAKIDGDKIIFNEFENFPLRKIELNYKYYNVDDIGKIKNFNWMWENIMFDNFQSNNFFLPNDIEYLKYLIGVILSSNLYKEIFNNFSNVSDIADSYFEQKNNIDEYINNIIFLPYKVSEIHKFAITDRLILSVLISGYPEKTIKSLEEYRIYRIIELSLRVLILADHEPTHYLKSCYSIITEGKISRFTSKTDLDIESGYYLEEILFGWVKDNKNPIDLSKFNLDQNINKKNKDLLNKKINLITALQLLNPEIYSKDLNHFRKSIYEISNDDLKNFSFSSKNINEKYKTYLQSVIDEYIIRDSWDQNYSVNASKESTGGYYIEYITDNHNIKY